MFSRHMCFEEEGFGVCVSRYPSDRYDYWVNHAKRVDLQTNKVFLQHNISAFIGSATNSKQLEVKMEYLDDIDIERGLIKTVLSSALCRRVRKTDEFQNILSYRKRVKAEYLIRREAVITFRVELKYARISLPFNEKRVHELEAKLEEANTKLQKVSKELIEIDGKFPRINMEKAMIDDISLITGDKSPVEQLLDTEYIIAYYKTKIDLLNDEGREINKKLINVELNRLIIPQMEMLGNIITVASKSRTSYSSQLEKEIRNYKDRLYDIKEEIKLYKEKLKPEEAKRVVLRGTIENNA